MSTAHHSIITTFGGKTILAFRRIVHNKGWDYCGNAQASVDAACQIILACDVSDAPNDKQQAEPMARATLANLAQAGIERPRDESGEPRATPSTLDNGY